MDHQITLESAQVNLTPYVLALMSRDLHKAAEGLVVTDRFPLANFLLYAMSIEIGLKASVLNMDNSADMKRQLKQEVGHNLIAAADRFKEVTRKDDLFGPEELGALQKLNRYFAGKQLEYFTPEMIVAALTAFSEFPPLEAIKSASRKLDEFLTRNGHFL